MDNELSLEERLEGLVERYKEKVTKELRVEIASLKQRIADSDKDS
jgi:hypothetical protein